MIYKVFWKYGMWAQGLDSMVVKFRFSNSVWKCRVVVKSEEKSVEYEKVVMAIEKSEKYIVERAYLARYDKKLGSLTISKNGTRRIL